MKKTQSVTRSVISIPSFSVNFKDGSTFNTKHRVLLLKYNYY